MLKSSPALAPRLAAAEAELSRLEAAAQKDAAPNAAHVVPRIRERYRAMLGRLEDALQRDPERARAALQDVIGARVILQPDDSGKFLWAEFGSEAAALVQAAVG